MPGRLELFGVARWQADSRSANLPDSLPGYLVAYLAYRGDWVGRESLVELFWPDRQESEALHNLRSNLHRVRRLLADWSLAQSLETEPRRMRLSLPTDVAAFRAAIGRGDWPAAAEMQREPFLSALSYKGFPVLEEWAQMERTALGNVWRSAALKAAMQHETAGQGGLACDTLLRLLRGSEPEEDAVQALLRVAGERRAQRGSAGAVRAAAHGAARGGGRGAGAADGRVGRCLARSRALPGRARRRKRRGAARRVAPAAPDRSRRRDSAPRRPPGGRRRRRRRAGRGQDAPARRGAAECLVRRLPRGARAGAVRRDRRADRGSARFLAGARRGKARARPSRSRPSRRRAAPARECRPGQAAAARSDRAIVRGACRAARLRRSAVGRRVDAGAGRLPGAARDAAPAACLPQQRAAPRARVRARRDRCRHDRRAPAAGPAFGAATDRAAGRGQPGRHGTAALLHLAAPPHRRQSLLRAADAALALRKRTARGAAGRLGERPRRDHRRLLRAEDPGAGRGADPAPGPGRARERAARARGGDGRRRCARHRQDRRGRRPLDLGMRRGDRRAPGRRPAA